MTPSDPKCSETMSPSKDSHKYVLPKEANDRYHPMKSREISPKEFKGGITQGYPSKGIPQRIDSRGRKELKKQESIGPFYSNDTNNDGSFLMLVFFELGDA